jgi:2-desacetyl-2-hydroxyethyl bacteriochlorophyllide A dehydrogenase
MTPSGVATVEVDRPSRLGRLVEVTAAGICGSDLHAIQRGPSAVTLGHEFGGYLDDGTLVAVEPHMSCGACALCLRGDAHLCPRLIDTFHGGTVDGGLADQVVVDERCLIPVPESVDPGAVGLAEPIAVAVHAVNRSRAVPSERALVIGGGSIGLLCAAVLRDRGVQVDVAARHPRQREAARALGAGLEPGRGYGVVIDAAGTASSFDAGVRAAARGGEVVLVALPWEPVGVDMRHVLKEVSITPAVYYGLHQGVREFSLAVDFLAKHPELPDVLITHRFGMNQAADAFRAAQDRAAGAIKVQLHP